jgi:hypothetical protein
MIESWFVGILFEKPSEIAVWIVVLRQHRKLVVDK